MQNYIYFLFLQNFFLYFYIKLNEKIIFNIKTDIDEHRSLPNLKDGVSTMYISRKGFALFPPILFWRRFLQGGSYEDGIEKLSVFDSFG